ncbi:MAG: DUF3106 domain-containing protein [Paucibacter sp.]|nr:DUF3106 domain-containing protein [Roseateles sp.]
MSKKNDFMPMKRVAGLPGIDCRKSQQAGLLLAAIILFTAQPALAQSAPPPVDAPASSAPLLPAGPATEAPQPAASASLKRLSPHKIAAPNALLPAPTWVGLTQAQKALLQPLQQDWDGLDEVRKSQWLEVATRFSGLPAQEQSRVQERMREWARLSPVERQQARVTFQGAKKITADERQAKWEAYQALPQEQRQQLADKAAKKLQNQSSKSATSASRAPSGSTPQAKSNLVPLATSNQPPKAIAASLLQAKPGATTVLITQGKLVPSHQRAGHTKVLANPELVDSKTLLPKRPASGASRPPSP